MARHPNWNPNKHRRLPNGQWAPTGRGRIVTSRTPRTYASRKTHPSQIGKAKIQGIKARRRKNLRRATIAAAAVTATTAGLGVAYGAALVRGPRIK